MKERLDVSSRTVSERLETILADRIVLLDGAMGTMIQRQGLDESDFRGDRFRRPSN